MNLVLSAAFPSPRGAGRALEQLRTLGIPCRQQLGRRVAHRPLPCPSAPHRSRVSVRPAPAAPHPAAVINLVICASGAGRIRKILRAFGGREISPCQAHHPPGRIL